MCSCGGTQGSPQGQGSCGMQRRQSCAAGIMQIQLPKTSMTNPGPEKSWSRPLSSPILLLALLCEAPPPLDREPTNTAHFLAKDMINGALHHPARGRSISENLPLVVRASKDFMLERSLIGK